MRASEAEVNIQVKAELRAPPSSDPLPPGGSRLEGPGEKSGSLYCPEGQMELTKHSRSLAGRDMMMKSFLTSSITKVSSELSERS